MKSKMTIVNVKKKDYKFDIFIGCIALIGIFFIIITIFVFGQIQSTQQKAPLLIDPNDIQVYTSNETNDTYSSTGYSFSGLQMACRQEVLKQALPNLPEAYQVGNCNGLERRVCIDNFVKGGGLCLSTIGGSCRSLYDCIPGTTACLNNICVDREQFNTINQPCSTDFDCQSGRQPGHICDPTFKICKYNYFPYETGCTIDRDCLSSDESNTNACIFTDSSGLFLEVIYNYTIADGDYLQVLDSTAGDIRFFVKNNNVSYLTSITSFGVAILTTNLTTINGVDAFGVQYLDAKPILDTVFRIYLGNTGGEQIGICVSKIPRGGKSYTIADVKIPCEDGLIESNGYCVENNFFSTEGIICDRSGDINPLKCKPNTFLDPLGENIPLTCLPNISLSNSLSQNYNYLLSAEFRNSIQSLGYCAYPTKEAGMECNSDVNNCLSPYLCYDVGNNLTFCGDSFEPQICATLNECQEGYECDKSTTRCLSANDNICIEDTDCKSGSCGGSNYIYYYSYEELKYIKVEPEISSIHTSQIMISFGNDLSEGKPTKIVAWSRKVRTDIPRPSDYATLSGYKSITTTNYEGDTLLLSIYTLSSDGIYTIYNKTIFLYPSTDQQFVELLIGGNGEIYAIYRKLSEYDRVRSISIISADDTQYFNIPINSGFKDGDVVIYRGNNYPNDQVYYIRQGSQTSTINNYKIYKYYLSSSSDGVPITMNGNFDVSNQIISYSYKYTLQLPTQSDNRYKASLFGKNFETGDLIELDGNLIINYNNTDIIYTTENTFYLTKIKNLINKYNSNNLFDQNNSYFYMISDDYNSSVPMIRNDFRTPYQYIYTTDDDVTLYLNPDSVTYSIANIGIDSTQYIVKDEQFTLYSNNLMSRNGINSGFTYNYRNGSGDPKFTISTDVDGNDSILINKTLTYDSDSKKINIVQKLNISSSSYTSIPSSNGSLLKSVIYSGSGNTITYINFEYTNTAIPPQPKGLYYIGSNQATLYTVDKSPIASGSLKIISGYTDGQTLSSNISPTLGVESGLEKTTFVNTGATSPPSLIYSPDRVTSYYTLEIKNQDVITTGNVYILNGLDNDTLILRNESDIETVLKYGGSELVFMKYSERITPFGGENTWKNIGQITLVVTGVSSYDVTPDGEELILTTHTRLRINPGDFQGEVINSEEKNGDYNWRLYTYNIYPLVNRGTVLKLTNNVLLTTHVNNFFDLSGIWCGTKKDSFFTTNNNYLPTSYNKIMTNTPGGTSTHITIIYVNDGYGNSDNYDSTLIGSGDPFTLLLPDQIGWNPSDLITIISGSINTTQYPLYGFRSMGNNSIFAYFYNMDWRTLNTIADSRTIQADFNGPSFIKNIDQNGLEAGNGNSFTDSQKFRPLNSGMLIFGPALSRGILTNDMYAVNNMYLSSLPKSVPEYPLFNFTTFETYYTIIDGSDRRKGSLMTGVDTYPYYPLVTLPSGSGGGTKFITNQDQSYQSIVKWPSWIQESGLLTYLTPPEIKQVYLSQKYGNFGGKFIYFSLVKIGEKYELFATESRDNPLTVRAISIPKSIWEDGNLIASQSKLDMYIVGKSCLN